MTGDEILKRAYEFAKEKHKNQKDSLRQNHQ